MEPLRLESTFEGFRYVTRCVPHPSAEPPVLFVSGAFQSMGSWKKFADHFSRFRTVVLCDLPGTGEADPLPSQYGLDFLACALANVLGELRIPTVDIVSASYGTPIAYRFAQTFPERVGRLVLAGVMKEIPADLRPATAATLAALHAGRVDDCAQRIVDGLLCNDPEKPVARRDLARRLLRAQLERMPAADRERYIQNTLRLLNHDPLDLDAAPPVPALVFTGEHDVYTRPELCHEVASAFESAAFTTIRSADHLFHLECFEATLALVAWFLRGEPLDPARYAPIASWCPDSSELAAADCAPFSA